MFRLLKLLPTRLFVVVVILILALVVLFVKTGCQRFGLLGQRGIVCVFGYAFCGKKC